MLVLRRTVVGCDPGESLWLVDCPGWCTVVLRRTVVGCDPGESMFVVG